MGNIEDDVDAEVAEGSDVDVFEVDASRRRPVAGSTIDKFGGRARGVLGNGDLDSLGEVEDGTGAID